MSAEAGVVTISADVTLDEHGVTEVIGDGIGDDDGICETGEACTPEEAFLLSGNLNFTVNF